MSHRLPPMVHHATTAPLSSSGQDKAIAHVAASPGATASPRLEPLNVENESAHGLPKAFKFGQVDQNMLISRLYSTPLNKQQYEAPTKQHYMLDMSMTSLQKPRLKKLEAPAANPEPIVRVILINFLLELFKMIRK